MDKFLEIYHKQDIILDLVSKNNIKVFLSGGTALHRFHFKNNFRYSEDLDFFLVDSGKLNEFDIFFDLLVENKIPHKLNINTTHFKQLKVFDNLKIELICDAALKEAQLTETKQGIWLDSLVGILANKLECIYSRDEPRDCFDIYTIFANVEIDIDKAFDILINKTNILPEEVIAKLIKYPTSLLLKDKILTKTNSIYDDFIKNHKTIFAEKFKIPSKI